jgi:hypothetical protein
MFGIVLLLAEKFPGVDVRACVNVNNVTGGNPDVQSLTVRLHRHGKWILPFKYLHSRRGVRGSRAIRE